MNPQRRATTSAAFIDHFKQKQNFLIDAQCIFFEMEFPPVEEVIDILRGDSAVGVRSPAELDKETESDFAHWVKTAPLEQLMERGQFALSHFELNHFYGPGQFLSQLQDRVMIPWRTFLSSQGFTWQRCAPYIFISAAGVSSTYHADRSHVVAWQVAGEKVFNGFVDPDQYALIEELVLPGKALRQRAPGAYDPADVLSYHMIPGDLLWNQLLTPHWVVAGADQAAMSLNISHGLVRHRGQFGPNEALLHQRWLAHPEEAWLADFRY